MLNLLTEAPSVMNLKPFLSWCTAQGIASPLQVRVRESDGYRYTVLPEESAATASDDGTVNLIQCPLAACITAQDNEELANRLSHEKSLGEESKFFPYISVLPTNFDNLPRFWEQERFDLVTDGGFLEQVVAEDQERVESVKDAWALACADSRAIALPDGTRAMPPLLDMINHDGNVQTSAKIENDVLFLNVAEKSIPPVESKFLGMFEQEREVCISYDNLTNLQTLRNYGFVAESNPVNHEFVTVNVFGKPPIVVQIGEKSVDPLGLGSLRRCVATEEELQGAPGPLTPFLSQDNEEDAYALLAGFMEESIDEAKEGAENAADDDLVSTYLRCRAETLQKMLDKIQADFPEVFG